MSHKTFLLLLCCDLTYGSLEFPINTKSADSTEKQSFQFTDDGGAVQTVWPSAQYGHPLKIMAATFAKTSEYSNNIEIPCLPTINTILSFTSSIIGRFEHSPSSTCPAGTIMECEDRDNEEEICKPGSAKPFTDGSRLNSAKDRVFGTQPHCPLKLMGADKVKVRFLNQSPKMKEFRKLGGKGHRNFIPTDGKDILVKPKAIPNTGRARQNDYLPGKHSITFTKKYQCGQKCRIGTDHFFEVSKNEIGEFVLHPSDQCEWARVCLKAKITDKEASCEGGLERAIVLLFKHGMVFSGQQSTGYILPMIQGPRSRVQIGRVNDEYFHITSGMRERVVVKAVNTEKIWVQASSDTCWYYPIEINGDGKTPTNKTENGKYIGTPGGVAGEVTEDALITDIISTHPDEGFSTVPSVEPELLGNANPVSGSDADEQSEYEGWLTWAIFYGFLAGTGTGFLICALIFYLARRSIYQDWYRGMYNRYHTDASGTTADGVYGEDLTHFTVGATTAGDQGVSITTTPTGTTTGMSAMSTTMTPSAMTPSGESKETGTQMNNTMITM